MIGLARLIRDHGDAVEADLAFRGIDMRDLWRHGSGMTLRRLAVLVFNLPADSATWRSYAIEQEKALKPKVEQIRARQAHYDRQAKAAEALERQSRTQQLEHELGIAGHEPDCPDCAKEAE